MYKVLNRDTKHFLIRQTMWIGAYFGISLAISLLVPFPYSYVLIIAAIFGLAFYRRRKITQKMGRGVFGGGGPAASQPSMFGPKPVEYYCISCGTKHNERRCPNCGSAMKRVGF